jgi:hypothetical protein
MQGAQEGVWNQEAYLLFPVHLDGTLFDHLNRMQAEKEYFPTITVLHIFRQVWLLQEFAIRFIVQCVSSVYLQVRRCLQWMSMSL